MTPQSNFMIAAPILPDREGSLRALLETMNAAPGVVDPHNMLFPFARFGQLHVARFVILKDETLADRPPEDPLPDAPVRLAFLGDCDGEADALLGQFAAQAADGLRQIFAHCEGFSAGTDLLLWMRQHSFEPATQYVNWVGRTVQQIREEVGLHVALQSYLARHRTAFDGQRPSKIRDWLITVHQVDGPALTPPAPTPLRWLVRHLLHLIGVPLALVLLAPFLLIYAPVFLWILRQRETTDPVIAPTPSPAHIDALSLIEDHDVTNQFSAYGSVKPGRFRRWTLVSIFWVLNFSTHQLYTRGRLARVDTIHFARWVFTDDKRRLFFASNYDGSLDTYMDDFINKVAFGVNLVFTNGIGFPSTKFLLFRGAKNELPYKRYLRRHQLPTQVWYKAYPGLTTTDLARNTMIREGLAGRMTDAQAQRWLALI
jgi:hypothetical protein